MAVRKSKKYLVASFSMVALVSYTESLASDNTPIHGGCPNLTAEMIQGNAAQFPHSDDARGGDLQIEGRTWQVWNAQSYIKVSDRREDFYNYKSFVEVVNDPSLQLQQEVDGPYKSILGGTSTLVCNYSYSKPGSPSNAATVQLIHEGVASLQDQALEQIKKRGPLSSEELSKLPSDLKEKLNKKD